MPLHIGYQRSFWFRFPQSTFRAIPRGSSFLPFSGCAFPPVRLFSLRLCSLTTSTGPVAPLPKDGSIRPTFPLSLMRMILGGAGSYGSYGSTSLFPKESKTSPPGYVCLVHIRFETEYNCFRKGKVHRLFCWLRSEKPLVGRFVPVTHLLRNLQKDLRNFLLPINTIDQILGAPGPCPSLEGPMAAGLPQPLYHGRAGGCFLLSAFSVWAGLAPTEKQCL